MVEAAREATEVEERGSLGNAILGVLLQVGAIVVMREAKVEIGLQTRQLITSRQRRGRRRARRSQVGGLGQIDLHAVRIHPLVHSGQHRREISCTGSLQLDVVGKEESLGDAGR